MKRGFSSHLLLLVLALFLIAQASALIQGSPSRALGATASAPTGYTLSSFSNYTQYGQVYVNETFFANSSTTSSLSTLTLGFPGNYSGHMVAESAASSFSKMPNISSAAGSNNTLLVTLSFSTALPAHTPGNVSLAFYVLSAYSVVPNSDTGTDTNYTVPGLFYPSVSTPIDTVSSQLRFPYPNTHVGSTASNFGFTDFVNATALPVGYESWTQTTTDVNYTKVHSAPLIIVAPDADSGIVNFPSVQRVISVGTSGGLIVTDTITVQNLGQNTLTSMTVNLLTNSTSVTNIPAASPPLSNAATATISGGEVSLSGINQQIEPNSEVTFILQYPLSSQYWNSSNGNYAVTIPGTLPVSGLVTSYSLIFNTPSGYVSTTSAPSRIVLSDAVSAPSASYSFHGGIGSAFGFAIPIAAVAFLGTFIAALVFKPGKGKSEEEKESAIDAMIKSIEDKVSGTNEIVSELKARGTAVTRLDLANARTRVDELRSKSASRLGTLRAELVDAGPSSQAMLNEVTLNDREFDRAIKDLLNGYDQFISRKMKADTFAKVQQNHEHKIQRITNSLLDELQDLRHDYEEEQ